jgi:hypothetical protein
MIRATYVPLREHLDANNYCRTAEGVDDALLLLVETLLPEDAQEAARLASVNGGPPLTQHHQPAKDETRVLAEHIAAIIASPNEPNDVVEGLIRGMHDINGDANVHGDANYVDAHVRGQA